jgi:hypothetical protein
LDKYKDNDQGKIGKAQVIIRPWFVLNYFNLKILF